MVRISSLRRWHLIGLAAAAVALVLALLYAIPSSPLNEWLLERKLVGKWGRPNQPANFEFLSDGTLLMGDGYDKQSGKWSVIEGNRVKLTSVGLVGETATMLDDVAFSGDMLSLSLNGHAATLERKP